MAAASSAIPDALAGLRVPSLPGGVAVITPVRRWRRWTIEGYVVEMPEDAPLDTPVPTKLADVPAHWSRRPVSPPPPPRPGGR